MSANEPKDVSVLIHYDEIGLKGKNRPLFIERLSRRIERAASLFCEARVKKRTGRLILETNGLRDPDALIEALGKVFGVAYFARARSVPLDLEAAANTALDMIAPLKTQSFRVRTRKSFPTTPVSTREWDRAIGAAIQARRHLPVDLGASGTDGARRGHSQGSLGVRRENTGARRSARQARSAGWRRSSRAASTRRWPPGAS